MLESRINGQHFTVVLTWREAAQVYEFQSAHFKAIHEVERLARENDSRKNEDPLQKSEPCSDEHGFQNEASRTSTQALRLSSPYGSETSTRDVALGSQLAGSPPGRVRWLSHEEAERLLRVARTNTRAPWLADFIQLALMTGMRRGELLGLEWVRVDWSQNLIYLERQKNGQRGSIPLNATARQALLNRARFRAEHCPASAWVFADLAGRRLQSVSRSFNQACRTAGIMDFHIHDLRHTCAAWLVQVGVPLLDVSQLLRHASIVMTQRYAHLAPQNARSAVAKLEAGDNLATAPNSGQEKTALSG